MSGTPPEDARRRSAEGGIGVEVDDLQVTIDVDAEQDHGACCGDEDVSAAMGSCLTTCTRACPVVAATGRADAVPWSLHRAATRVLGGTVDLAAAAPALVPCSGCGACTAPCTLDAVPDQLRAARARVHGAGAAAAPVEVASSAVAAGRSPFGTDLGTVRRLGVPPTVVLGGCRDTPDVVAAALRVLAAADLDVGAAAAAGCCGAVLRDLGDVAGAEAAGARVPERLHGASTVVLLDPHCRGQVAAALPDAEVVDLLVLVERLVAAGELVLRRPPAVAWHEPCLLRGTDGEGAGRRLLTAAGALVELAGEPHPGCAGGGLGLPLLDPGAAAEVAGRRVAQLGEHVTLVTGCAGAAAGLAAAGGDAHHVAVVLASLLHERPEPVA